MLSVEMAKVTSKGQVTIPISIRKRLNINEGDKLLFIDRPDGVMMVNPNMLGAEQSDGLSAAPQTTVSESNTPPTAPKEEESPVVKPETPPAISETPVTSEAPATPANAFDVSAILNEIRSIGSKI